MTNTAKYIKNSWSLLAFAKAHEGRMQVGEFINRETAEVFHSCIFGNADKVFVKFSRSLGVLTPQEISALRDNLQVVLCETEEGKEVYVLCKQGDPGKAWQEVDLGL